MNEPYRFTVPALLSFLILIPMMTTAHAQIGESALPEEVQLLYGSVNQDLLEPESSGNMEFIGPHRNNVVHIEGGRAKTFLAICGDQLLELSPGSSMLLDSGRRTIGLTHGLAIINSRSLRDTLCYEIFLRGGAIGRATLGRSVITLHGRKKTLEQGDIIQSPKGISPRLRTGSLLRAMIRSISSTF